jgi:uncharacterized protein YrzB (UPF0473 family)
MSHEHDHEEVEYVVIPDEDGNEEQYEVLYKFEVDETGKKYMLIVPAEETDDEEQEVLAFRYEEEGEDGFTLYTIDNDDEWDLVEEAFNTFALSDEDEK